MWLLLPLQAAGVPILVAINKARACLVGPACVISPALPCPALPCLPALH
jgi:hypothetical protein